MCFSVDVSVLAMVIKAINVQRGKVHLIISMEHSIQFLIGNALQSISVKS